jgi:hypothetical protein
MNKLWCFGDSFTAGQGCRSGDEYFKLYPNKGQKIWTTLLAEKLSLEEINLGIPGNSNPYILKQIIENLKQITDKDIVILSDTLPFRSVLYNQAEKNISPITTDIAIWPEDNPNGDLYIKNFFNHKKDKMVLIDYLHTFKLPYHETWTEYYLNQFLDIQSHLLKLNTQVYFWSHKIWKRPSRFEIITNATNRKVIDGHWSWKGHKDFSNYLLERINKQEYLHNPALI